MRNENDDITEMYPRGNFNFLTWRNFGSNILRTYFRQSAKMVKNRRIYLYLSYVPFTTNIDAERI